MHDNSSIPYKANRILYLTLCALALIGVRIWHLIFVQYEEKFEESKKTQRRVVLESPARGTLRDRFNLPLAVNKVAYRAAVAYSPIRHIPFSTWEIDAEGKKIKIFKRKAYVKSLAALVSKELDLDADRIVDLIYSKSALYFHIPYVIKDELSEEEYSRLKMMEKDWPGLCVERYIKRDYPKGKCCCDLIGYMGAISCEEFEANMREKLVLEQFLNEWENGENPNLPVGFVSPYEVRRRFKNLQELAYTANDCVGKSGIEALFEEELRGFQGRSSFYSDSKGKILQNLPGGRTSIPGKRILLSISLELQEYAEALLAQAEDIRKAKVSGFGKNCLAAKQPWIKGGAIVALDPLTGEVLTLASYPRFDPNDFVTSGKDDISRLKKQNISRWFENEAYIAGLWNQHYPLKRERYDRKSQSFHEEEKWMTWPNYLEMMLPKEHPIVQWFLSNGSLQATVDILKQVDDWEKMNQSPLSEGLKSDPELQKTFEFLPSHYNCLLFVDLCQLAVHHSAFSEQLLSKIGAQPIDVHVAASAAFGQVQEAVKEITRTQFHATVFKRWRELHEKNFLKEKREWEKEHKAYPKPYIDYLDAKEKELFTRFWQQTRYDLCLALLAKQRHAGLSPFTGHLIELNQELSDGAHPALSWRKSYEYLQASLQDLPEHLIKEYLMTLRSYEELNRPLKGTYRRLRNKNGRALEKHLAAAFYPLYGYGYGRSHAFRQSAAQGSIFKLVTAYEALLQKNHQALEGGQEISNYNPLEVIDETFKIGPNTFVGYSSAGTPIPQIYKGGRLPRSHTRSKGRLDLMRAIETSSNVYFSLLAGDVLKAPQDLAEAAKSFGFGEKSGIELPGEIRGKVPNDLAQNRTGLYALAIGQHSLVVTPLQTALMLAAIANQGELLKPHVVKALATTSENWGEAGLDFPLFLGSASELSVLGLDLTLFGSLARKKKDLVDMCHKTVRRTLAMPKSLREFLLKSLHRVVIHTQADSLWSLSQLYSDYPEAISDYIDLKHQIVGKTSTAEVLEQIDFDEINGRNLYTHVWFGGIAFEDDVAISFSKPELVVIVYLRFGSYGKESAPIAAQIVRKWREIKKRKSPS